MKIRVVLPDPRPEETEETRAQYAQLARPGTEVSVVALAEAVPPGADPTDPYVLPAILRAIQEAEQEEIDAVIIHCMEDPGLDAGRQLVNIPVVGPAQASFHVAAMLGYKFSVLFPLANEYYVEKLVRHYGLLDCLASVKILDASLDVLATDWDRSVASLLDSSLQAVREDGAHAIVLGCMYATGMATEVQVRLAEKGFAVPVLDPGLLALRTAETLVDLGVSASKRTYPQPLGISEPYW